MKDPAIFRKLCSVASFPSPIAFAPPQWQIISWPNLAGLDPDARCPEIGERRFFRGALSIAWVSHDELWLVYKMSPSEEKKPN